MGFDAYYDPEKDTIENCKEGSMTWWHEKGHQEFYRKQGLTRMRWIRSMLGDLGYFGIVVALSDLWFHKMMMTPWPLVFVMLSLFFCIVDESIAWMYCLWHWREWR